MKKIICLILGVLLLAGCTPTVEPTPTPTPALSGDVFSITDEFVIIKPIGATPYEDEAAKTLRDVIKAATGIELKIRTDIGAEADKELIVGAAVHGDAYLKCKSLGQYDWLILGMTGSKLILAAGGEEGWSALLDHFSASYVSDGAVTLSTGINHGHVEAPRILRVSPEDNATLAIEATPTLFAHFVTGVGVDTDKSGIKIDGVEVKGLVWENEAVTGISHALSLGEHTMELTVTDNMGQATTVTSKFVTKPLEQFKLYRGEIHSHTQESDGMGTLEEAYTYAREQAKLDFFAVTDHSNKMNWEGYSSKQIPIANSFNVDGRFTALYGVEMTWGVGGEGHINVLMPSQMYGGPTAPYTLSQFYKTLARDTGALGQFNHPNLTHGKFEDFGQYSSANDEAMALLEFQTSSLFERFENYYAQALTLGWHVSPVFNEDTHNATWGTALDHHTVVLATDLSRKGITEALHQGRTYITNDKTAKLSFTVNGTATLGGTAVIDGETAKVRVELSTEKSRGVGLIELIGNNGVTVATYNGNKSSNTVWEADIPVENDFLYVRVNSNGMALVSAPIYLEKAPVFSIENPVVALAEDGRHALQLDLSASQELTDVKAEYWIGAQADTDLTKSADYVAQIGVLNGKTTVTGYVEYSRPTYSFITVRISGKTADGKTTGIVYSQPVSPYYITEIAALTSAKDGIANAFTYIEVYNNTDKALDLGSYKIGVHSDKPADREDSIENGWSLPKESVIAPRSTAVLWIKAGENALTVDDFNAHYGTALVEGENIFIVTGNVIPYSASYRTHMIVYRGETEITRISYNYFENTRGKELSVNTTIEYGTHVLPSLDQPRFATKSAPSPGVLSDGQLPTLK